MGTSFGITRQTIQLYVMTVLFIIAIAVFAYMCYVLMKPEKF